MGLQLTGTGLLLRQHLRRDRWHLVWWTLGLTLTYWSQAVSIDGLYVTQEELDRAAASMEGNVAFVAMTGPTRALNTVGGQVAWQATAFGAVLAGLMSMFLLGRHTRVEEETGRDELVRSSPVGRRAPTTAALLVVLIANVLVGAGVALSLVTYPLAAADSVALGVGLTLTGLVFTGTALVAMQLTSSARAAYGIAGTVLGVSYGLRAIGDVTESWLTWLSPIGWYQAMHAFSGLRWWPALLLLAAASATVIAAYALLDRRDAGAGLVPARPGRPEAGARLLTAPRLGLGLAWRLQRGSLIGWTVGLLVTGLSYGSIGDSVGDLMGDSDATREMFLQGSLTDLVDGFYATSLLMLAILTAAFAVASALRPRGEEDAGRVEALLTTGLSRRGWLAGHAVVTITGTLVVLLVGGLGIGVGYALVTGDGGAVGRYLPPMLAYVAPVLLLVAVAWLLVGLAPRWASLAWVPLGWAVVVLFFGELLRVPQWLQDLSPFEHLALVPAEEHRWTPVLVVAGLAIAVTAAAQVALARRDIH